MLVVLFITTVKAQQRKHSASPADKIAKKQTGQMISYLNLNPSQQKTVFNLNKMIAQRRISRLERKKIWTKGDRELSEREKLYLKKMQSQDRLLLQRKLKEVLTKKQYQKWEAKNKRAKNYLKKRGFSSGKRNQKTKQQSNKNRKTYHR